MVLVRRVRRRARLRHGEAVVIIITFSCCCLGIGCDTVATVARVVFCICTIIRGEALIEVIGWTRGHATAILIVKGPSAPV